jgi:hypothetical protein
MDHGQPTSGLWCCFATRAAFRLAPFCLIFTAGSAFAAEPQTLSETRIETAFIFNFTRFVDWPVSTSTDPTSPFLICVVGADPLAQLLREAAVGKAVRGRAFAIKTVRSKDDLRLCQILYLGAGEGRQVARVLESVKRNSVLTVSEIRGFASAGGLIGFVVQDNKMRLEMNLEAAKRTGLTVSSRLVEVSRLVSSNPALDGK